MTSVPLQIRCCRTFDTLFYFNIETNKKDTEIKGQIKRQGNKKYKL